MITIRNMQRGEGRTFKIRTRNAAGALADPDALVVQVRNPSAITTTYTYDGVADDITRTATGLYSFSQTFDASGTWYVRIVATGAVADAENYTVIVADDEFN